MLNSVLALSASASLNAPSGLSSTNIKSTLFTLHWAAATGGTRGITGYDLYRDAVLIGTSTTRTFVVGGLMPVTTYRMTVIARDGAGNVSPTSTALPVTTTADTTKPTKPTGLTAASITTTSFTLTWTAATDNVGVVGYNIYRAGTLAGTAPTTTFALSGLAPDTNNRITVRAIDAAGNLSAASVVLVIRTLADSPSIPSGLSMTNLKTASLTLKWTASTGGTGGIAGYDIYRNGAVAVSSTKLSFAFSGLIPLTTYRFTVIARDHEGRISAPSLPLVVTTPADTTKPTVPTGLSAAVVTHNSFTLLWTPSTDNVGVTGYDVLKNGAVIGSAATASYNVTGVTPLTTYQMRVKATDAAGNISAASAVRPVTTSMAPNVPPSVTLTSPGNGATFSLPLTLTLSATATDSDGSVTKVEFFDGTAKLGEATTPSAPPATFTLPFDFTVVGTHTLFARATDNRNATGDSAPVSVRLFAGLPYLTDFEVTEGYTPGSLHNQLGWTVASGTAQVTSADSAHGEQSLVLGAGVLADQEIGAGPSNPSPVFADLFAKPVAGADPTTGTLFDLDNARVAFVLDGASAIDGAQLTGHFTVFDGDGTGAGTWKRIASPVALDANHATSAWLRLSVRLDYTTRAWDLYLDGRLLAYGLKFRSNTATCLSGLSFQGRSSVGTGLDDIYAGVENPLFADIDRDGMDDVWEVAHGLDPTRNDRDLDLDGDGLTNIQEYVLGTDPSKADTDDDGLTDPQELVLGTNLTIADTDGDGMPDGWEQQHGLNPLSADDAALDADGDGQSNLEEYQAGTDPADFYNGSAPIIRVLVGGNGSAGSDGGLQVQVVTTDGQPLPSAPVTFSITAGVSQLAASADEAALLGDALPSRSLPDGTARVYYRTPAGRSPEGSVKVQAGAASLILAFQSASNQPPTVTLTAPLNGVALDGTAGVVLVANASDPDGTIALVEFFADGINMGEAAAAPYSFYWPAVAPGNYLLTAKATDTAGASALSLPVSITVVAPAPALFSADFEVSGGYVPGPLAGQRGWLPSYERTLIEFQADAPSGENVLRFDANTYQYHPLSPSVSSGVVFIDFQARLAVGESITDNQEFSVGGAKFSLQGDGSGISADVMAGSTSEGAGYETTGAKVALAPNQTTGWHRYTLRLDYPARSWDLYLDGLLRAADLELGPDPLEYFSTANNASQPGWLDHIQVIRPNPLFADADADGMDDAWEATHGLDPTVNDRNGDPDGDGLTNIQEFILGTHPNDPDTDHDGLPDGWEVKHGYNPVQAEPASVLNTDADGDGLTLVQEAVAGTDPNNADTDGDGMPDGWEYSHGLNPLDASDAYRDADADGISNRDEFLAGTNPVDPFNGQTPVVAVLSGANGNLGPDGEISARITDIAGAPLTNAPVEFTVTPGSADRLITHPDSGIMHLNLTLHSDDQGLVHAYLVRPRQ